MSGKHLCQSRLSAAYISSNRYMHIILFYFRLFILFSPGLPFIRPSSGFSTSFIRPCSSLPSSFFALHPAFLLPFHCSLSASSLSFSLLSPHHFNCSLPVIPGSTGNPCPFHCSPLCLSNWPLPVFSNVHPLRNSLCSPPSFQFSSPSFPARPGIPCHPEPVLLVILSASEGSSPTDFSIIISKHTKI